MYRNIFAYLFLTLPAITGTYVHAQDYIVERASFSSRINDEFSPVYYKGGIVFCSNMRDNSLAGFSDEKSRLFKIFYVKGKVSHSWGVPELLSKELTSGYNDGPVTFDRSGSRMYYSRNNSIVKTLGNITDPSNKLGIYSADFTGGAWKNISPFEYNNPDFSLSSPSLSPEEDRIYFSSDMPGGFGGMDLYYCESVSGAWQKPVNLGPVINTSGNETFPFACSYKKLYFSSDGHGGFGGKDLFYSQETNGNWIPPVHLDSAINSPYDDFGIVLDSTYEHGFFSSKRFRSDDIFSFRIAPVEFTDCDTVRENSFCYTFYDEKYQEIDTIPVTYIWNFGDGNEIGGPEIRHCFKGPGKYNVNLIVIDNLTADTISLPASYDVELEYIDQAYIRSPETVLVNDPVQFEIKNDLKGVTITDFLWDFGKGFEPGGQLMERAFSRRGEYAVRFGLLGMKNDEEIKKCYIKRIHVYSSLRELNR